MGCKRIVSAAVESTAAKTDPTLGAVALSGPQFFAIHDDDEEADECNTPHKTNAEIGNEHDKLDTKPHPAIGIRGIASLLGQEQQQLISWNSTIATEDVDMDALEVFLCSDADIEPWPCQHLSDWLQTTHFFSPVQLEYVPIWKLIWQRWQLRRWHAEPCNIVLFFMQCLEHISSKLEEIASPPKLRAKSDMNKQCQFLDGLIVIIAGC